MKQEQGYITLILVLCVSAVAVLLVTTLFDRSIRMSQGTIELQDNTRARVYADSCIDYALDQIATTRQSPCSPINPACVIVPSALVTSGSYQFQHGDCSYQISGSDPNYSIQSNSVSGSVQFALSATTNQIYPTISLSSYQEI